MTLRYVIVALLLWMPQGLVLAAVQVKELYDVEVAVRNQGAADRQRAMQQGFAEMITRLSGSRGMQQLGQSAKVLKQAGKYVEQYRYRKSDPENATQQDAGLILWMRFNPKAMQKLLQEQQLPVWGSTRPQTMLWIAVDNNRGRYILRNNKNALQRNVLGHARRRAVPVILPQMDAEDRGKVRMGDVWGGFSTSVKLASARYSADNILIGKLYPAGGGWRSEWTLVSGSREKRWSGSGSYAGQAMAAGIDGLADHMASRYAVSGSSATTTYRLAVSQVNSLQDYDRSSRYLRRISLISGVRLYSISQGQVVYLVDLRGDVDDLERALQLERQLLPDNSSRPLATAPIGATNVISQGTTMPDQGLVPVILYYRLRP